MPDVKPGIRGSTPSSASDHHVYDFELMVTRYSNDVAWFGPRLMVTLTQGPPMQYWLPVPDVPGHHTLWPLAVVMASA